MDDLQNRYHDLEDKYETLRKDQLIFRDSTLINSDDRMKIDRNIISKVS